MTSRLSKGEKPDRKRMAQAASVCFIDRFVRKPQDVINGKLRSKATQRRPRPIAKRIRAGVEKDAVIVIQQMFNEACTRDPDRKKEWVVLIDGQKSQIKAINAEAMKHKVTITVILDIVHVIEYLWKASRLYFAESSSECEDRVQEKLTAILNGKSSKVAGSIRMSSAKRKLSKEGKKVSETCADYLAKNASYMNYHEYLGQGYPIGTGVIEGTCRYLIKDRMDITGARWGLSGAEAVLKLRSIIKSDDFEDYWIFHLKQNFLRNYEAKYKNINLVKSQLSS